ncbi:ABC transporter ATP-binding protein [Pleionea sp. CnH1-48]|uniref:ABC transporter ATP-binding protein n=1 Tax=Pleionea sp. CnH1-48 TaxID=2954494 RepID=UPI002097614B|nr:ABC transporter ATP-binding protein [Pleionea sp. CnH1-48]MCO7227292.1 ABC transporter ATP-binding protein/permease [Pleionea sp. CnH1-48]
MHNESLRNIKAALNDFFGFAPTKQSLLLILMLIQSATTGVGLLLILPLLNTLGVDTSIEESSYSFVYIKETLPLEYILAIYVLIISVIALLNLYISLLKVQLQQNYIAFLRTHTYQHLLSSRWQYLRHQKSPTLVHNLTVQIQNIGQAAHLAFTLLSQMLFSITLISVAFFISWKMTLYSLICMSILSLILIPLHKLNYSSGSNFLMSFKDIFSLISEQLHNIKYIKVNNKEKHCLNKITKASHFLEKQNVTSAKSQAIASCVYLIGSCILFSVILYGSLNIVSIPIGEALLLIGIYARLLPSVSSGHKTLLQLYHKSPSMKGISDFLTELKVHKEEKSSIDRLKLNDKITLSNIEYKHPDSLVPTIKNLNFTIKKNQVVAISGPSGSGKSTLADLIAGLIEPCSGEIYCDRTLLSGYSIAQWRNSLSYVTQETLLFDDTLRNNITDFLPEKFTDEEIWNALHKASADEFVRRLPQQLDTPLGEHGMRLSCGQKQRLSLARALINNPQVLILDEVTSALDKENINNINSIIEYLRGSLTTIIISHHESSIKGADQIIYLNE